MSHYYTDNRNLPHNRREFTFRFSGLSLKFETDSGVFSKDYVDTGTQILLQALQKQILGDRILDMGCGYGVIGIVLKKLYDLAEVTMCDINPRAIECSVSNAQRNGSNCKILVSEGFNQLKETYTTIVCNPPIRAGKAVIYKIFEDSAAYLESKGSLWIVMRKQHGAPSAIKKLETLFEEVEIMKKDRGFQVIRATGSI